MGRSRRVGHPGLSSLRLVAAWSLVIHHADVGDRRDQEPSFTRTNVGCGDDRRRRHALAALGLGYCQPSGRRGSFGDDQWDGYLVESAAHKARGSPTAIWRVIQPTSNPANASPGGRADIVRAVGASIPRQYGLGRAGEAEFRQPGLAEIRGLGRDGPNVVRNGRSAAMDIPIARA